MSLAVCYILKNEAEYIERSLRSIVDLADEIVIRDHHSDDGSLEKIDALKIKKLKVISADWADDFSLARNEAAKLVKSDWILFIDGDEVLEPRDHQKIRDALKKGEFAYSLIQRNYTYDGSLADVRPADFKLSGSADLDASEAKPLFYFENWMERLYRPSSGIHYEGRIHESLIPSASRLGMSVHKLPVVLHHFGRLKKSHARKLDYYRDLTRRKLEERPDEASSWVEWMLTLDERHESEEAFAAAQEAVNKFSTEPLVLEVSYRVALRAGAYVEALSWIEQLLTLDAKHPKALIERTIPLLYLGRWDECAALCESLLKNNPKEFLAHLHLGIIFFERKQWASAKRHLQLALSIKPQDDFLRSALEKIPSH